MATLDQTIQIILTATDKTGDGFRSASAGLNTLADSAGSITGPLAKVTDAILAVDAVVTGLAAALVGAAINETMKFQDSLQLVQKQLGATDVSIETARATIEGLATTYGENANDVAKATAAFLAAGYNFETSAKLVETSTRLMIAGDMDAVASTEAINKSIAGFRIPAADAAGAAEHIGDVLNKIGDISSGSFDEIVQGFTRLSPTAKDAGLSMEETAAMVAVLVDTFGSGELAATALKSGFLSLLDPSKDAREKLGDLRVALVDATTGALRPAKDIMADLAKATDGQTSSQKLQTASVIFGKEQAGAMNALLGDWGKSQGYVAQMMDATTGAVGSMGREVESKLALISTSVKITDEKWRQFLEHLGAKITTGGEIDTLIDNVGGLGDAFKKVVDSGALDPLLNALRGQAKELSDLIAKGAANLPAAFEGIDWSGVLDALGDLKGSFGTLFEGLDLTTVEGLKKAIQGIVDTGETLIRITSGIVEGLKPFIDKLGELVHWINSSDDATKQSVGELLGWAKGVTSLLGPIGALGDGIGALGTGMQALAGVKLASMLGLTGEAAAAAAAKLGAAGLSGAATSAGAAVAITGTAFTAAAAAGGIFVAKTLGISDGLSSAERAANAAGDSLGGTTAAFEQLATAAGKPGASIEELNRIVASGEYVWDRQQGQYVKSTAAMDQLGKQAYTTGGFIDDLGNVVDKATAKFDTKGIDDLSQSYDDLTSFGLGPMTSAMLLANQATESAESKALALEIGSKKVVNILRDASGAITGYGDGLSIKLGPSLEKVAKKTDDATKKTDEFKIKMEEIASNERIKTIEAKVSLDIAKFETDAQRVKDTFASIDNSINSTGSLLGSLFGDLTNASAWDKLIIEDQIKKENALRQQSFELQKKLAEAEIARIEAQVRAMDRGDTAIKIDGTGLAPELEAFMWKILKAIRVRANAEFQDYLLGIAA